MAISFVNGAHAGEATGDTFVSIERYRLSSFDDQFAGNIAPEQVFGAIGNDTISGGGGNDDLRGEAGNDTIDGGVGAGLMAGGIGNDTFIVDDVRDDVTALAGEASDSVQSSVTFSLAGRFIENLTLNGGSTINGVGNSLDNVIIGKGAANSLSGADGNDTLNGGGGTDLMSGGNGNDTYLADNSGDKVSESNSAGTDLVLSSARALRQPQAVVRRWQRQGSKSLGRAGVTSVGMHDRKRAEAALGKAADAGRSS